ncbi:MAG: zonular occludens toxin domain-containing protein [Desulfococcaceae bacterium]
MIYCSTGKNGAGKTYWVVRTVRDKYMECVRGVWRVKDEYLVLTNINGFNHENVFQLDDLLEKAGGISKFFNFDYQTHLTEEAAADGKSIVYLIDECQSFFRKYLRDQDVFLYFEKHRHLGHVIYMTTQHLSKIPSDLRHLIEYEVKAVPRGVGIPGTFIYNFRSDGDHVKRQIWKVDKSVFSLYKSQEFSESEKLRNPLLKWVFIGLIFTGGSFYFFLDSMKFFDRKKPDQIAAGSSSPSSAPLAPQVKKNYVVPDIVYDSEFDFIEPKKKFKLYKTKVNVGGTEYKRVKLNTVDFYNAALKRHVTYIYNPVLEQFQSYEQAKDQVEMVMTFNGASYYMFVPSYSVESDFGGFDNTRSGGGGSSPSDRTSPPAPPKVREEPSYDS